MSARVYVGGLADDARERDVEKFFKGYGRLREIVLKNGYGFVEFEDKRDAEDAIDDLDGKDLCGMRVRIEQAKARGGGRGTGAYRGQPPGNKTDYRVIVTNLSSRTSWQDLKDFFRSAGEITFTNAHKMRTGEGVVEFADRRGMDWALDKLDDTELDGRRIRCEQERSSRRSKSRSRSRGRGDRSRSRSRSRGRGDSRGDRRGGDSKSRSRSRGRDGGGDRGRDRDGSRGKERDGSRGKDRDGSRSRSRSRSRD